MISAGSGLDQSLPLMDMVDLVGKLIVSVEHFQLIALLSLSLVARNFHLEQWVSIIVASPCVCESTTSIFV
ncbi:hypothetical protein H924_13555 (plasmid) [Corynebacterium callunae DSM 20147]|uniref:Uncharacterized protein n=1 Tax=Corynebacterium callunae DSM 20147 TaxID=1121353 RepID=M1UI18_9CORY|nr:hypothetical protein H924_13555 [Corynebacterium callunae DSM 20147]